MKLKNNEQWVIPDILFWSPLQPERVCEFEGCIENAYQMCDMEIKACYCRKVFEGCYQNFCMTHATLGISADKKLDYYCC